MSCTSPSLTSNHWQQNDFHALASLASWTVFFQRKCAGRRSKLVTHFALLAGGSGKAGLARIKTLQTSSVNSLLAESAG